MGKKDFTKGFDSIFGAPAASEPQQASVAEPNEPKPAERKKTGISRAPKKEGAKNNGDTLHTVRMDAGQWAKLQAVAYWERTTIKDILAEALGDYFDGYERKHGQIEDVPNMNSTRHRK